MINYKFIFSLLLILFITACSSGGSQGFTPSPEPGTQEEVDESAAVTSPVVATPVTQTEAGESEPATSTPTSSPIPAATSTATRLPSATPVPEATSTPLPTIEPAGPDAQLPPPAAFLPSPPSLRDFPYSIGDTTTPDEVPSEAETAYLVGITMYAAGQSEEAVAKFDEAINLYPEFALAYYSRANVSFTAGDREQALQDYNLALEIDPELGPAYWQRAKIYAGQREFERALADYEQVITRLPDQVDPYLERDWLYLQQENYEAPRADLEQVISLDPNNALAYVYQGIVRKASGEAERALADFSAAIELDPGLVEAYANRGVTFHALGQTEKALADYQQVLELATTPELRDTIIALRQQLTPPTGSTPVADQPTPTATAVQSRGLSLEIQVGQPFVLALGQEAHLAEADLILVFKEVVEDSRCPTQVDCFWSGQARIAITVQQEGSAPGEFVLNTNPSLKEDVVTLGAYKLQLIGLEPYPEHPDRPIPPEAYEVTLVISK